ncbi:MAG: anticodon nuclease [Anaerorhabdus sp.]
MEFDDLNGVANELINNDNKKINILYAFNGTGKTRLSTEYTKIIDSDENNKVLYFNSFIEDSFTWTNKEYQTITDENSLIESVHLKLDTNSKFFHILKDSGKEKEVNDLFQRYTQTKIEPNIDFETGEIKFNIPTGDEKNDSDIKISRGEESVFKWSVFYVLVEEVIEKYNAVEDGDAKELDTSVEYIFIDDPVSSLDDNHILNVVLDLSKLLKSSKSDDLRFVVTTHHALFYNVLHNEFKQKKIFKSENYLYKKVENKYILEKLSSDSPFAYHLEIKRIIEEAIKADKIYKYHFTLLRNLLEKTSTFLGYSSWDKCIIANNREAYTRVINLYSHNKHSLDESKFPTEQEKIMLKFLFENFIKEYNWNKEISNE